MTISRKELRRLLDAGDLAGLFVELGWTKHREEFKVAVGKETWSVGGVAEKAGFVVYSVKVPKGRDFPDSATRRSIEKDVSRRRREHLIVFIDEATATQTWQWVRREAGRPVRLRDLPFNKGDRADLLLEKIERLFVSIDEEEKGLTVLDIARRAEVAGQADKVTKKFYDRFKREHDAFKAFISGIGRPGDVDWYASLMLNRLMFIYFLQRRKFLDGDSDYLRNRLAKVRELRGKNKFHGFYRSFLLVLFHQGLGSQARDGALENLIGRIPYLNGGLFDLHKLETENPTIDIPDEAFEALFNFFDEWDWHLDERPLRAQNEINPDVLGFIFEKFINQKQMGAYYTKEDITEYITRSTVVPRLVAMIHDRCKVAFDGDTAVWRYVAEDPDRYIFPAVRHGLSCNWRTGEATTERVPLPDDIAAGINDIPKRTGWNKRATDEAGLPTETWREVIARRQRHDAIRAKLAKGDVRAIEDFVTLNLDIRQFLQDVIERAEGPDLLDAVWQALTSISILDPTCGSGAFLFAALNVLEPLYEAALERMEGMLAEWRRANPARKPPANSYMERFAARSEDVHRHPSERYFILKTIVLRNLYGVDLMEEAVEICKLRLFLKLVAQLETADQIEPLPDLDFNVRAGNTLVGFATRQQVRDALGDDMLKQQELPAIEEDAEIASRAFKQFREQQTRHGVTAEENREAKREVRRRLDALAQRLDVVLAKEYGIGDPLGEDAKSAKEKEAAKKKFSAWRESHQPFHWFVEFYGILHDGGFDAIIGNPPYVAAHKVRSQYGLRGYETASCSDIYACVLERVSALCNGASWTGMIVPLSLTFSDDFSALRALLFRDYKGNWFSSYARIPSALFSHDVRVRNTIHIGSKGTQRAARSTRLHRWFDEARESLFGTLSYAIFDPGVWGLAIPKLPSERLGKRLESLLSSKKATLRVSFSKHGDHALYFKKSAYNWLCFCEDLPPCYDSQGVPIDHTEFGAALFDARATRDHSLLFANGKIQFAWWCILGDDFHLTLWMFADFPIDMTKLQPEVAARLKPLRARLLAAMKENVSFKMNAGKKVGNYNLARCRDVTDQSDKVFAEALGLTEVWDEIELLYVQVVKTDFGSSNDSEDE